MPDHSKVENGAEEQLRNRPMTTTEEGREPWPEEAEPPSKRERARSFFREHPHARWILILVVLLIIVGGIYTWRYYGARESTDDAQIDGHIVPVSARVGGTVTSVNVADNQFVPAGTVLVQLDPRDYDVAVQRARADLNNALAAAAAASTGVPITTTTTASGLNTADAALTAARKQVDAARARVREAQANYNKVSADLKRAQQLVAKDEISQQQYDSALAAEQSARASLDAANSVVASAESQVAQAQAAVQAARTAPQQIAVTRSRAAEANAAAQKSRSSLEQAELNFQYTTVRAPFAGIVSKRSVEPGQVVSPGQPLFALVDLEDVYVTANFKETQLEHMCPGQSATIHVDAYARDYKGHVDSLSGATGSRFSLLPPENATGNYVKVVQRVPVKIVFEPGQDPNHLLRPGLSVEPTVMVNKPCAVTFAEAAKPGNNNAGPASITGSGTTTTAPNNTAPAQK